MAFDAVNPDRLVREVTGTLPSVLQNVVQSQLADVVRDFCRKSWSIKADIMVTLPAGVSGMTLPDINGFKVIKVLSGRTSEGAALREDPTLRHMAVATNVSPRRYYCPDENQMTFDGAPTADTGLVLVVAVCPRDGTVTVPDSLYEQRYEALLAGVLGRLYMQPSKPYSNVAMGRLHWGRYNAELQSAKIQAMQELTKGDAPWQYPRWA